MIVLGIDTSCDDTSCAILEDRTVLSDVVSSQDEFHRFFGGVVPEIASRKHAERIDKVFLFACEKAGIDPRRIDLIGVTVGPGLIGSLLVGLSFAKGLSLRLNVPIVAVNHIHAHAMSIFLERNVEFPFLALVVSGGHTILLLLKDFFSFEIVGSTRDDAAGEAFDKIAKFFGLGYPGGRQIEEIAKKGNRDYIFFPRPMVEENHYDFSFSGLKTAVINYVKKRGIREEERKDLLASFQEAIVDVLVSKTIKAAKEKNVERIVLGGGVSANERLRMLFSERAEREKIEVFFPSKAYCLDNGAMVGITAFFLYREGICAPLEVTCFSRMEIKKA